MDLGALVIVEIAIVGGVAGVLGGLLGVGGSVVMIPALVILLDGRAWANHHLIQAAAMATNVAVAIPAALRHRRAGAVRRDLFRVMLPATGLAVIAGVLVSNALDGAVLRRLFAVFLVYVIATNVWKLIRRSAEHDPSAARVTTVRAGSVGGLTGFMAGLLGIGGGGVAVPLAQIVCRLPLRQAIGTSSAVMVLTAGVGATVKLATLDGRDASPGHALIVAAILAPAAIIGARGGAGLTHTLPLPAVRAAFVLLLVVVALRMGGLV